MIRKRDEFALLRSVFRQKFEKKVTKIPYGKVIAKNLQVNTLFMAAKFISGNTLQIAPLCQPLDHIMICVL